MLEQIRRESEQEKGLAWLVRALIAIGRESAATPSQAEAFWTLQSMLVDRGQEELIEALEVVKCSLPGYAEYVAGLEAMATPEVRALGSRLSSPNITELERETVRQEAANLVVGNSGMSPQEFREAFGQLSDPSVSEEQKRAIRERLTQMLRDKRAAASSKDV